VLIPCRPDRNDVVEAVRTQEVIRQAEAMTRRTIPHSALLTQVNPRAQVTAQTRTQLDALGIPYFGVDMPSRTAYQQASYTGAPLADPAVQKDVAAIAAAVTDLMEGTNG
jgi:chromosome partitioning protein